MDDVKDQMHNGDYVAPRDPVEAFVAEVWARLLGLPQVGVHDNFLLLGGESLLAIQAASQICARFDYELSMRSIFVKSVAEVAAEIQHRDSV